MKVIIKKITDTDGFWFKVTTETGAAKHISFDPSVNEDSINSEKNAFQRAMTLANWLENAIPDKEEIVYETPEPEKETVGINLSDLSKINKI